MDVLSDSVLSSSRNIFVLYLILSSNFLANLFGCRVQDAFAHEMWLKHLLGFMTLYFFVVLVNEKSEYINTPELQLGFSLICYIIFILSTRMDYKWWVVFIVSLCIIYILQIYKDHEKTSDENKRTYSDYQKYLSYFSGIILIIGFIIYLGKKKVEYKDKFSWFTFLLGKEKCSFNREQMKIDDYQGFVKAFQ